MYITIRQKKMSIRDRYQIMTDGRDSHYAKTKLLRLFAEIDLFKNESPVPAITVKRKFSWLRPTFDFYLQDGRTARFQTKSLRKSHYQVLDRNDLYDIFNHRGRKFSIFKNDIQIAWWDKDAFSVMEGDNYQMIADYDANAEMLMAICLTIDNAKNNKDGKLMKVDLGNVLWEGRKFDPAWLPRNPDQQSADRNL